MTFGLTLEGSEGVALEHLGEDHLLTEHEQTHMPGVHGGQQGAMSWSRVNERGRKRKCQRSDGAGE